MKPTMLAAAGAVFVAACVAGCQRSRVTVAGPPKDRLAPVVVGTNDVGFPGRPKSLAAGDARPAGRIEVDEKAHIVHVPVRPTGARGSVEWLLAAGRRQSATAVLVTEYSARDVADALTRAGLKGGTRPRLVGDDRAVPPTGPRLSLELVITHADGRTERIAAERLLAAESGGRPLQDGAWIYAGPPLLREGEAELLVTALSGSIATTSLRDLSALIYWVPGQTGQEPLYVTTYYASDIPLAAQGARFELAVRPANNGK